MILVHDPLACKYSHSVFRIWYEGKIVEATNYSSTIGKGNSTFSKIRQKIRQELKLMIIPRQVFLNE
ncbi:hypothetical protein GCM10028803_11990 [Larkinella knui]